MNALMFVLGLAPIIWLIIALMLMKWPTWQAAVGSFLLSVVLALFVWHLPLPQVATAALEGFLMALWPIVLVIIAAVFTYNLCVDTGAMDVIGNMITSISSDRRLLAILVAWCFGGFMEGMAGFGVAIAIPAGMLAGLSFDPLAAVLICLFANGAPTAYGSIGIPTVSLANLVGLDSVRLAFVQMVQLAPFLLTAPLFVVMVAGRVKGENGQVASLADRFKGVLGIALASGISYVVAALAVSYFVGAELTVVVGAIVSLGVTAALSMRAEKSGKLDPRFHMDMPEPKEKLDVASALKSWSCFIIIFVVLLCTSSLIPAIHDALAPFASSVQIYNGENPNTVTFTWVNTPGVWILLAALIGGTIQGATPAQMIRVFKATVKQMLPTVITMLSVLGCAKVMGYSGMITSISTFCIAVTGSFYPLIAPWFGALGSFVTGSGTSSGLLFGSVQGQAAQALGINEYWTVGLNSLGVGAGKMFSPQSLAIGLAAVHVRGKDSELMREVLPYGLAFMLIMSVWAMLGLNLPL